MVQNAVLERDVDRGSSPVETDTRAMGVAIALFFMVGFLTCLNDIIIPHLKSIFELSYGKAMLVQFAFFSSYFVFSYPGGKLVDAVGAIIPLATGGLADRVGLQAAFLLPSLCYVYIAAFGFANRARPSG